MLMFQTYFTEVLCNWKSFSFFDGCIFAEIWEQ